MIKLSKKRIVIFFAISSVIYWILVTYFITKVHHPYIGVPAGYISFAFIVLIFSLLLSYFQNKLSQQAFKLLSEESSQLGINDNILLFLPYSCAWALVNSIIETGRQFRIEDRNQEFGMIHLSAWRSWKSWGQLVSIKLSAKDERSTSVEIRAVSLSPSDKLMEAKLINLLRSELEKNNFLNVEQLKN